MHAVALKSPVNFVLTDTEARPLRSLGVDRSHELNIASLLCVVLLVCYPLKAPETITTDKIKVAPPKKMENTRLKKGKLQTRSFVFHLYHQPRVNKLTPNTGKHIQVRISVSCVHANACRQRIHTHIYTDLEGHENKKRTQSHTNTLINTASHRSSALHVGHGIKGGGSAGV